MAPIMQDLVGFLPATDGKFKGILLALSNELVVVVSPARFLRGHRSGNL